ncbi:MAG TPA: nucleotidyltransferase domain-containing protein [Rubrobacter sp.]|nr:nucleotidyltransferase domain-containing protein [Rubrobacter sp.]
MTGSHPVEQAEHVAERLGNVKGVVAVALGGSITRGAGHPNSDVDLGIYYRPDNSPSVAELRRLAGELDDRHPSDAVTSFGEWGPWVNGGGWLVVEGQRMDWLYRDLDRVEEVIAECRAGRPTCYYQVGHPHGFHNHMYIAEVHHNLLLFDPDGALAVLKEQTVPYPPPLKSALIKKYLWEAHFALETSRKPAGRGDVFYVSGCAFRCVACLVQVLFALNERYFVNEKGSVRAVRGFTSGPPDFEKIVEEALGRMGVDPANLEETVDRLGGLVREVEELCEGVLRRDGGATLRSAGRTRGVDTPIRREE